MELIGRSCWVERFSELFVTLDTRSPSQVNSISVTILTFFIKRIHRGIKVQKKAYNTPLTDFSGEITRFHETKSHYFL